MSEFTERHATADTFWRSIVLFGQNVASYKFALAHSLIEVSSKGSSSIDLELLLAELPQCLTQGPLCHIPRRGMTGLR
jgi:hypothetical protein